MVEKRTWKEFRDNGFLWWINMILHTFGWAIVAEFNDNKEIINAYPARVKYRGFDEEGNTEGYIKVSEYMNKNSQILLEEAKE